MYSELKLTLVALKYLALAFVFTKYIFQFNDYGEIYADMKGKDYYLSSNMFKQLLGITNTHVTINLLALALVMVLANNQLKYLKTPFILAILSEF